MAQAPAPLALRMRGVGKSFGGARALAGVDLEVRRGEIHALIGENGAGKSTLMKVLSGALRPDAGSLELDGEPFAPHGPLDALRHGVAMIYQEPNLALHLTVEQNVTLGREAARGGWLRRRSMRGGVERALAVLGHADLAPDLRVADLGPGARQLVEIARALAGEARVLVMDEPTSSLSRRDVEALFAAVRRLRQQGVAVVYISHFLEEVQELAERYTVLRDGRSVAAGPVAGTSIAEFIRAMTGRKLEELFPKLPRRPGPVLLRVRKLAGRRLPVAADLELRRGEILGIAGLVGAGRSELLRALFGLDPLRGGEVWWAEAPVRRPSPRASLRRGLGLLSEDRQGEGLALGRPVAENLVLCAVESFARFGWLRRRSLDLAAAEWTARLQVRCRDPRQPARELSGGNQQKLALARLLLRGVDLLLLDEPTRGVDVACKAEIYRWIAELAAAGTAVLMVSSYLPELLGACDRIAVMHRGVLGPARPAAEWSEHALLEEATRGAG